MIVTNPGFKSGLLITSAKEFCVVRELLYTKKKKKTKSVDIMMLQWLFLGNGIRSSFYFCLLIKYF